MNENVDGMMIRLVGLALAVLMMAGMTIYTGLFKKTPGMDAHATVISVQDGHVAAEDVQWNA
jgi:NADPH-dependent curcumin reductase CurA